MAAGHRQTLFRIIRPIVLSNFRDMPDLFPFSNSAFNLAMFLPYPYHVEFIMAGIRTLFVLQRHDMGNDSFLRVSNAFMAALAKRAAFSCRIILGDGVVVTGGMRRYRVFGRMFRPLGISKRNSMAKARFLFHGLFVSGRTPLPVQPDKL